MEELKRWTREARNGSILDRQGRKVVENPKLEAQLRYKFLSHKFHNLAYKVSSSPECCLEIDSALDCLSTELEDKLNISSNDMNEIPCKEQENVQPNVKQRDDLLSAVQLKKKEVQSKNSKRTKTWIDKLRKVRRKQATKSATPRKTVAKQQQKKKNGAKKYGVEPLVPVENDGNKEENVLQEYPVIGSFTRLLAAGTYDSAALF